MRALGNGLLLSFCAVSLVYGATASNPCDVNQDNTVNVTDVQRLINEGLGKAAAADDLNQDGKINVQDAQIVSNAALNYGCLYGPQVTILDFTPKSGPAGTLVSLTGSNFGSLPQVSMPQQGGGTVVQRLTAATVTSASFVIAAGSATGAITVSRPGSSASTAGSFTVTPASSFGLAASPPTATLIAGQTITYAVQLSSADGFAQLAPLSVTGLPNGVTASFKPMAITAGQTAILTLKAPAALAPGNTNLTIKASATVNGIAVTQSAAAQLSVVPATTSFIGRAVVSDDLQTPLAGVKVTTLGEDGGGNPTGCTGHTTVSDAAGNFALTNLPQSCIGPQMIGFDGDSVSSPPGKYAGVNLIFTLVSGQVVVSPVLVHLPRIDTVETFMVQQNSPADQSYIFQTIPGLSVTVYAGTTLRMADGSTPNPFPLAAIDVPIDRLPDQMPLTNSMVTGFIVAFQPANTTASQAVAVSFPNTLNTPSGTSVPLMTLDPTRGRMVAYGTGTISNDASSIIPDFDPSTGTLYHRYGIIHFDWHGPAVNPPPAINPPCNCPTSSAGNNGSAGDPVDVSTGLQTWTATDLSLESGRGTVMIERTYRTNSSQIRSFGIGSSFNYDYRLDTAALNAANLNLQYPNGVNVPFTARPDGTLVNTTTPEMSGAVMTVAADGTSTLRFKTGAFFTFDANVFPRLTSLGDPNGNVIRIVRDDAENIIEIDDPSGRKLTVENEGTLIKSITDPIGRKVTYGYTNQYLTSVTDVLGGVTQYKYDGPNRLESVTDPRGIVQMFNTYYPDGRVKTQTTPSGGTISFNYTLSNTLVPTSPVLQTVVTDARQHSTTYRFNPQGYIISVTDAIGQTRTLSRAPGTNFLYHMSGYGTCDVCGDPGSGEVGFIYEVKSGNIVQKTDSLNRTWYFTYDPVFHQLATVKDPLGNVTAYTYDGHGNLIQEVDARQHTVNYKHGAYGLLTQIEDEDGKTTKLTYDPQGNVTSITDQNNNTVQYSYDGASRMIMRMDAAGQVSKVTYNNANEPVLITDENGKSLTFHYDDVHNSGYLEYYLDSNNGKTSLAYDPSGRLMTRTNPLLQIEKYEYDKNNNLVKYTNRRNQQIVYDYDELDRPTKATYPDATVDITYDTAGRVSRLVDSQSGTFDLKYNDAGELVQTTDPNGTVDYVLDNVGRIMTRQVKGEPAVNYSYDENGNLLSAVMGSISSTRAYDKRNFPMSDQRSNGVTTSYGFDPAARLTSMVSKLGPSTLMSRAFTYDPTGQILMNAVDSGLPLATQAAAGTYDIADRMQSFGAATYTHDNDGNRLTETSGSGNTTYTWDSRGRLSSLRAADGTVTSFVYDPSNEMIGQTTTAGGQTTSQRFILDAFGNVASLTQGSTVTSILDGNELDDVVAYVRNSAPVFPLLDQIRSESTFVDAAGNVTGREWYEPYGAPTTVSGTAGEFLYSGRPLFNGTLFYNRKRFYDSTTGRFISEDPIGLDGGKNAYAYAEGDPISQSDPSGLSVWIEQGALPSLSNPFGQVFGIHQKICVGKLGAGNCWSMAKQDGASPFGGQSAVYQDVDRDYNRSLHRVSSPIYTSDAQDQQITEALNQLMNTQTPPYWLVGANCVDFSHMVFNAVQKYGGFYTNEWRRQKRLEAKFAAFRAAHPRPVRKRGN